MLLVNEESELKMRVSSAELNRPETVTSVQQLFTIVYATYKILLVWSRFLISPPENWGISIARMYSFL